MDSFECWFFVPNRLLFNSFVEVFDFPVSDEDRFDDPDLKVFEVGYSEKIRSKECV